MNYIPRLISMFVLSTLIARLSAQSNELPKDTISNQNITEVTVTALSSSHLSFPVQTVGSKMIDNNFAQTPADLISRLAGVSVSRDGAWATSINIRGFSEQKLMFMSDGDRMLTATDIAGTLSTVNLQSLDKIELIKGAGSVLYGTGAMGGIVNFVPYRPSYSKYPMITGKFSGGYQSVSDFWNTNGRLNITNRDWYLSFQGGTSKAGNTKTPKGVIKNSQVNDENWSVIGGKKIGENQEFLFNYSHYKAWDVGIPGGLAFPDSAKVKYLNFSRDQMNGEYIFKNISSVLKEIRLKGYTQQIVRDVENIASNVLSIYPSSNNRIYGGKATANLYFNDYNQLLIGTESWARTAQTTRLKITVQNTRRDVNENPNNTNPNNTNPNPGQNPINKVPIVPTFTKDTIYYVEQPTPDASMFDAGVFANYQWKIDPKYLILHAGTRLDFVRTTNDKAVQTLEKYKFVNGVKTALTFKEKVLFKAGIYDNLTYAVHLDLNYMPFINQKFSISLANAYRVASLEERFKYIDQSGKIMVGNPDLKPEQGWFSNFSYQLNNGRLVLQTDLFVNYLHDLIGVTSGDFVLADGTIESAWINTNIDKAIYYGGEFNLEWILTRKLSLLGNVSYVKATDISTGGDLAFIPPLNGVISLDYDLLKQLTLSADAGWEYEFYPANGETTPHRHMVFALSTMTTPLQFGPVRAQLSASVQNIFNKAYTTHMSTLRGINQLEPGRNFTIRAFIYF